MKLAIVLSGPALVCLGIDTRVANVPPLAITAIQTLPLCLLILVILMIVGRLLWPRR